TLCTKAAEAGCTVVKVRPEYTSQRCSACGRLVPKTLSERRHVCTCGAYMGRDKNAASNVERLGLQALQLTRCRMEILGHSGRSQWGNP
ncbi:MAG: transposase, partial [Candidatus Methanomethylophilus sp.]|nr:transposase [Methanomethylophilus sp.]